MGCASSSPLVESGKNFVNTAKNEAGDVVTKGEKTLQGMYFKFNLKKIVLAITTRQTINQ